MKTLFERMSDAVRAGDHHCHWPGCNSKALPFCRDHWWRLPRAMRVDVGAEIPGALEKALEWIAADIQREQTIARGWQYDL